MMHASAYMKRLIKGKPNLHRDHSHHKKGIQDLDFSEKAMYCPQCSHEFQVGYYKALFTLQKHFRGSHSRESPLGRRLLLSSDVQKVF